MNVGTHVTVFKKFVSHKYIRNIDVGTNFVITEITHDVIDLEGTSQKLYLSIIKKHFQEYFEIIDKHIIIELNEESRF
jgi:hypothetical protein